MYDGMGFSCWDEVSYETEKNKIKGVFSQQHSFLMLCPSLLLEEELLMLMLPPLTDTAHNSEFSSHQKTNVSWPRVSLAMETSLAIISTLTGPLDHQHNNWRSSNLTASHLYTFE